MASTTLAPIADVSFSTTYWVETGVYTTAWEPLSDGSDSNCLTEAAANDGLVVGLSTPTDATFNIATAVTINLRAKTISTKSGRNLGYTGQVFQSDGSTPLTVSGSTGNDTTSWATYSFSVSLSGSQTLAAWTGARLAITSNDAYSSISGASVTVTYSQSGGGGSGALVIVGAGGSQGGNGSGSSSVYGSFGRKSNRVEGVRFRHQFGRQRISARLLYVSRRCRPFRSKRPTPTTF